MVCDCCGKKKKLFGSYAAVATKQGQLNFCVDCNDIAYKVRDAANERNRAEYEKQMAIWDKHARKPSSAFIEWKKTFIAPLKAKISEERSDE